MKSAFNKEHKRKKAKLQNVFFFFFNQYGYPATLQTYYSVDHCISVFGEFISVNIGRTLF